MKVVRRCACVLVSHQDSKSFWDESAVGWLGQGLPFSQDRSQCQCRTNQGSLKNQHTGLKPGLFDALLCWDKMHNKRKKEMVSRNAGRQNYLSTCKQPSQPSLCQPSKAMKHRDYSCPRKLLRKAKQSFSLWQLHTRVSKAQCQELKSTFPGVIICRPTWRCSLMECTEGEPLTRRKFGCRQAWL